MRNGLEDMEYEFAGSGCRVDPLPKADQIDLSVLEVIDGLQKFFKRPAQAIETDDGEGVVGPGLIKQGRQTGPVKRLAGDDVLEHANCTMLQQPIFLAGQVLVGGGDPCVSGDFDWHSGAAERKIARPLNIRPARDWGT